ncbi:MAG: hypothetical protein H6738_15205 [Alphaproteobacteria bacterium]|nr:hypothetical protein [Alphaproteobacteria bacterium]MCB9698125.1 hypothetical protein [Alphaproteobacteria bacterium]
MWATYWAACTGGWPAIAGRERPWWEDSAALERVEDLDLVEMSSGESVGYWPRVVVRRDRIDVDDRAPALARWEELPPEAVVERTVATLVDGVLPGTDWIVPGLEQGLRDLRAHDLDGTRVVLIVPDAATSADTLFRVGVTVAQQAGSFVLAGAAEGRVRAATATDEVCPVALALRIDDAGGTLTAADGTRLLPSDTSCPASAEQQVGALEALWRACGPTWDTVAAAHPEAREDWRCLEATPLMGDAHADVLLRTLGALHGAAGDVRTAPLGAARDPAPVCGGEVTLDALDADRLRAICAPVELEAYLSDEVPRGPFELVLRARQP